MAIRLALMVTLVGAAVVYKVWDPNAAYGVLLGGIAGIVVFWATAVRLEKLAQGPAKVLQWNTRLITILQCVVYAGALYKGYSLDTEHMKGFIGAALGIFVIRGVVLMLGVTGFDLRKGKE